MAHKKRQKLDRTSTAAYAASQPIFDALRNAADSVTEQSAHLTKARDISQSLHAKIVNGDDDRHAAYMDSAVKAWKSATDTYCAIFEQLVSVTAADPTEGRAAGKRHLEFAALLNTAKRAKDVIEEYEDVKESSSEAEEKKDVAHEHVKVKKEPVSDEEEVKVKKEPVSDEDDSDAEPASFVNGSGKRPLVDSANEEEVKPATNSSLLNAKHYSDKNGRVLWENGELKVPLESLKPDERKAWGIIGKRKHRKDRRSKVAARKGQNKQDEQGGDADVKVEIKVEPVELQEPTVEYEDITAQVEERIKAKEAKKQADKAARKAERKRKRESGDSFIDVGAEETVPEPPQVAEPLAVLDTEKPAKKKSRKSHVIEAAVKVEKVAEPVVKPAVNGDEPAKKIKKEKIDKPKKRKEVEAEDDSAKQEVKKRKKVKGL